MCAVGFVPIECEVLLFKAKRLKSSQKWYTNIQIEQHRSTIPSEHCATIIAMRFVLWIHKIGKWNRFWFIVFYLMLSVRLSSYQNNKMLYVVTSGTLLFQLSFVCCCLFCGWLSACMCVCVVLRWTSHLDAHENVVCCIHDFFMCCVNVMFTLVKRKKNHTFTRINMHMHITID